MCSNHGIITKDMSDAERYELLKDRVMNVTVFDDSKLTQIDDDDFEALDRIGKSGAFKILRRIGEEFGVFRDGYRTQDVDVEFSFSKGGLRESIYHQNNKYSNFAKLLLILDIVINNAIGIETHKERYNNPGSKLDSVFILVSAFSDAKFIIPVLLEIKTYTDNTKSSLYVILSLNEINRSRIVAYIQDTDNAKSYTSPTSINISLAELLSKVNESDKNLLKYIPDGFLDDSQKEAKQAALKETAEHIERKNLERSIKTDKKSDDSYVGEAITDYTEDETCVVFVFHYIIKAVK